MRPLTGVENGVRPGSNKCSSSYRIRQDATRRPASGEKPGLPRPLGCVPMPSSRPAHRPTDSGAIDRAAGPAVAVSAVPAVLAAVTGHRRTALSLLALPLGVAAFFRDPDRTPDHRQVDRDLVLAPADGKVMHAGPAQPEVAPPGDWQQV